MIYSNLIINKKINNNLNNYIVNKKIPNAFLFHGNEGSGKLGHALEFCASLLCSNKQNSISACSTCSSCNKIKNNIHENIKYIYPQSTTDSQNHDLITEKIKNGHIFPYFDLKFEKKISIPISSIRAIKKDLSLSNINDEYQIHFILEAEKLCFPKQESANALLKILEEPSDNNLFILISSNYSKIIDTIKSRTTQIYFPKLESIKISKYLENLCNLPLDECEEISNLSSGNIIEAKKIINNYASIKDELKKILKIIYNNEFSSWVNLNSKKNKSFLYLDLLKLFFLDIILIKNKNHNQINFKSFDATIEKFLLKFPNANYQNIINFIDSFFNNKSKNAYLPLSLIDLFINIQSSLNNEKIKTT